MRAAGVDLLGFMNDEDQTEWEEGYEEGYEEGKEEYENGLESESSEEKEEESDWNLLITSYLNLSY